MKSYLSSQISVYFSLAYLAIGIGLLTSSDTQMLGAIIVLVGMLKIKLFYIFKG